ncbi:MAG TPA: DUF4124 domain-containing protein, partial [Burkholderiales bacterium]|nr:DUF4124 domain-containing protein [Burkholderiales bacterium]
TAIAALVLSLSATLPAAAGQLYKWTDANGRIQYSDTPPPDRKTETLRGGASSSSSSGETASKPSSSYADQDQAFRKRRAEAAEDEEKLAKEEADKKRLEDSCKKMRNALANMEKGGRFSQSDEKGERQYLTDSQVQAERDRLRNDIETHCNS